MALLPTVWQENINDNNAISYAGREFYVDGEKSWSFNSVDNNTLRFEVRKGDQFSDSVWTDPIGVERAEMSDSARYSIKQDISVEYKFMIEPGAKNTAKWVVVGQLHSALSVTPPVEIKFNGNDKMAISGKSGSSGNIVYRDLYQDSQDIVRGHWYTMKMNIHFDPFGNGSADIWRDGVKIVDYNGALGYTDQTQTYWKEGVYRSTAPETFAVSYKDLSIHTGAGAFDQTPIPTSTSTTTSNALTASPASVVKSASAVPTAAAQTSAAIAASGAKQAEAAYKVQYGTAGHDNLKGTVGVDVLYGYGARDVIDGGAGDDWIEGGTYGDTLYGRAGNDRLLGQSGNDVLRGGAGNDFLDGGKRNDRIGGGAGDDVLYGRSGNDRLSGHGGNDRLLGGTGNDVLTGGSGADAFVLTTASSSKNHVLITDFDAASDWVELSGSIFKTLAKGALATSAFHIGTSAASADDHIIYNSHSGAVYYDADGAGGAAQIHIATLSGAPKVSAADFFIV